MKKRLTITSLLILSLAVAFLAGCGDEEDSNPGKLVKVTRGDLKLTVSADGNLVMPQEVELRFGTTGTVKEVLVEEGDKIREGTLLARLDNTSQKIAIKRALYDMQLAYNDLAEQGCRCSKKLDYPYAYPNTSALRIFEEAQKDLENVHRFLEQGYHKEAAVELRMTQYDLELCMDLLDRMITNVETSPDSAVMPTYENKPDLPDYKPEFLNTTKTIARLQQDIENLANVQKLIEQGTDGEVENALNKAQQDMITSHQSVKNTTGQIARHNVSYPDTATSVDFLQSAKSSVIELRNRMEEGDYNAVEFAEILRLTLLDLQISRDILENNEVLFESGLNLKEVQQYNLNLQKSALDLKAAKKDLTKTEILAPFDGIVVDVGVAIDDQLSANTYSSRTAVKLVDTRIVKLDGIVGEIDIFKVKVGQKATITIDARPDEEFTGTITFISPFGTEETGVVNFTVTIELDPMDIELRGDLTTTADIIIADRENVLLIPTQAIIATPMGSMAVVINKTTGERERRQLVIGAQDYQFAEVISGLNEGETVIIIDPATVEAARSQAQSGAGRPGNPHDGGRFLR